MYCFDGIILFVRTFTAAHVLGAKCGSPVCVHTCVPEKNSLSSVNWVKTMDSIHHIVENVIHG